MDEDSDLDFKLEEGTELKSGPSARLRAMDLLARREHSALEIRNKLLRKGHEESEIEATLADLQNENLQSDTRFAEMLVRSRSSRGQGPLKVKHELSQHHLDSELVNELVDETDWFQVAREVHAKKFGNNQPVDYKEWARRARFMQSRGFGSGIISTILNDKEFDT